MTLVSALAAVACDQPTTPSASATAPTASAAAKTGASPATSAAAPAASGSSTPTVAEHMKEHFTRGLEMRDAIVAGDLAALKKDAQWMAEHEVSATLPETWKPHVGKLQDAAKKALDAADLKAASVAVAETAQACGSCHVALGGPKLKLPDAPAPGTDAKLQMARHQWAADRFWDGLVTPSEDAWIKGSEVMADAPLVGEALTGPKSPPKEVDQLNKDVHQLAEKMRAERDVKKWTEAYGQFLATCSQCHTALKPAK